MVFLRFYSIFIYYFTISYWVNHMGTFVNVDSSGRMVLPKKIREVVQASCFDVRLETKERIVFVPVKSTDEMFGSMPELDIEGFRKEHAKER